MITSREVGSSLYGALRLARADASGMFYFDTTIGGFWRSFYAAMIVLPLYAVLLAIRYSGGSVEASALRFGLVELITYVLSWVAFPLIMETVSRQLGREERYLGYIVAYNWAAVWQNLIYMPIAIIISGGLIASGAASLLGFAIIVLVSVYIWFITRTALDIPGMTAAGLVVLDLILSIFINAIGDSML